MVVWFLSWVGIMRYLLIIIAILSVALGWYVFKDNLNHDKITSLTTENSALKGNLDFMEKRFEKEHKDKLAISQRNKELEEAARQDNFNWMADISNSAVIKRLQAN